MYRRVSFLSFPSSHGGYSVIGTPADKNHKVALGPLVVLCVKIDARALPNRRSLLFSHDTATS